MFLGGEFLPLCIEYFHRADQVLAKIGRLDDLIHISSFRRALDAVLERLISGGDFFDPGLVSVAQDLGRKSGIHHADHGIGESDREVSA